MTDRIVLRLTSESEKEFFSLISRNCEVKLKYLCRKVCRDQVFKILKRIEFLQEKLSKNIIKKKADFCKINKLPIIILQINSLIEILEFKEERFAVIG